MQSVCSCAGETRLSPRVPMVSTRWRSKLPGTMRVTVIGSGYVGSVTGACLAYIGHRVTCVDTDQARIEKLRLGEVPIYEPGLQDLLALARERGGIAFETDLTA